MPSRQAGRVMRGRHGATVTDWDSASSPFSQAPGWGGDLTKCKRRRHSHPNRVADLVGLTPSIAVAKATRLIEAYLRMPLDLCLW
jgi:hypothetical protein